MLNHLWWFIWAQRHLEDTKTTQAICFHVPFFFLFPCKLFETHHSDSRSQRPQQSAFPPFYLKLKKIPLTHQCLVINNFLLPFSIFWNQNDRGWPSSGCRSRCVWGYLQVSGCFFSLSSSDGGTGPQSQVSFIVNRKCWCCFSSFLNGVHVQQQTI